MPVFTKTGDLLVSEGTTVKHDVRRVVSTVQITDVLTGNPLMTFLQTDQTRIDDAVIIERQGPDLRVYHSDIKEAIQIGEGRTITADELRTAITMVWAARAAAQ